MGEIDDTSTADLRDVLDRVDDAKAAKRLMVTLAYRDGVDVSTLSDRYGFPESTIYYWLDRIESEPLEDAIVDDKRPGRPPKLSPGQREIVAEWLADSPCERGVDADEWTPAVLADRIRAEFDVDYSRGHVRRLLRDLDSNQ